MIVERIFQFLTDPRSEDFNRLALDAFAYQHRHVAALRRLCERRRVAPAMLKSWQQIPLVPTSAFKFLRLQTAPAKVVFRSSGTTLGSQRSVHEHPFPELYHLTIERSFPEFCLHGRQPVPAMAPKLPMLSLVPSRSQCPDSSLSFMVHHVLQRYGSAESLIAFGSGGVEPLRAAEWLAARQQERGPVLILTTALALLPVLETLATHSPGIILPRGSILFETGGFKGKATTVSPRGLQRRIEESLGLPATAVVQEYGMTELTSQAYTRVLLGGEPDLFFTPPWMKVRILDPVTLEEASPGTTGLIAVLDLANVGSALHLLTEDLGVAEGRGFRLVGRATGSELRGCSLTAEELAVAGAGSAASRGS